MSIRDDLKAYIDGELPLARMDAVRQAVECDPVLANEVDELRAIGGAMRAAEPKPTVEGLERTLAALGPRRSAPPLRSFWPVVLAAACVGAGVLLVMRPTDQTQEGTLPAESKARVDYVSAAHPQDDRTPTMARAPTMHAQEKSGIVLAAPKVAYGIGARPAPAGSMAGLAAAKARIVAKRTIERDKHTGQAAVVQARGASVDGVTTPLSAARVNAAKAASSVPPAAEPAPSAPTNPARHTPVAGTDAQPEATVVLVDSIPEAEARLHAASIAYTASVAMLDSDKGQLEIKMSEGDLPAALAAIRSTAPPGPMSDQAGPPSDQNVQSNRANVGGFGGGGGFGGSGGRGGGATQNSNQSRGRATQLPPSNQGNFAPAANVKAPNTITRLRNGQLGNVSNLQNNQALNNQALNSQAKQNGLHPGSAPQNIPPPPPTTTNSNRQLAVRQGQSPQGGPEPAKRQIILILRKKAPAGKLDP